jgi:Asp-tRNA(Asn)/Glu-tRNA(Gln) amidotransferase A subunit family amidase
MFRIGEVLFQLVAATAQFPNRGWHPVAGRIRIVEDSPTISLPSGFDPSGLPLGVQLIGPHLSEATLCRAGDAFQRITDFHISHPVLID